MAKAGGGGGASGFKIATGFVDVLGRVNRAQIRTTANKVGGETGRQMATAMGAATGATLARQAPAQITKPLAAAGKAAGAAMGSAAGSALASNAKSQFSKPLQDAGETAGALSAQSAARAAARTAPALAKAMGQAGNKAGQEFANQTNRGVMGAAQALVGHAQRAGRAAADAVMGGVSGIGSRIGSVFSSAGRTAGDRLARAISPGTWLMAATVVEAGKRAGRSIPTGLQAGASAAGRAAASVGTNISDRLTRAVSPGMWLMAATAAEAGKRAGRNLSSGLQAGAAGAGRVASGVGTSIAGAMTNTVVPAAQRLGSTVASTAVRTGQALRSAFGPPMSAIGSGFGGLGRQFSRLTTTIRSGAASTTGALGGIGAGFKGMAGIAAAALGAIGIGKFVAGVFEMSTAINEARASLTGMYGSAEQANEMVASINSEFRRSTVGVGVLNSLAANLAYMGFEGEQAVNMIRNIDTAAGALPGDAAAAVDSVSNALLTAQVQGNAFVGDLNAISRVGFPIFDALAQHIGVTSGEIKDMASQGEISFEDLMHVMNDPSMSQYWEMTTESAKNTSQTFSQSFAGMVNAAQVSVAEIVDSILTKLAPGMNRFADVVDEAFLRLPGVMSEAKDALERAGVIDAARNIFESISSFVLGALPIVRGFATGFVGAFAALTLVLDPILGFLQPIGEWMQNNEGVVRVFGIAVGIVAAAFLAAKLAALGFTAVVGVIASPIVLVAAAVGLLAAGLYMAWERSETFRSGVTSAWEAIQAAWETLWEGYLQPGLEALGELWERLWPQIKDAASGVWDGLVEGWQTLWGHLQPALMGLVDLVREHWPTIKQTALDVFETITDYIEEIRPKFERIFDSVVTIVQGAISWIAGIWEEHGSKILGTLDFLWTTISGIFKGAFTILGGVIMGAWQVISGIFSGALDVIGGILDFFIGLFTGNWSRMWDGVKSIFSGLWTAVVGIFKGAVTILGGVVLGLISAITAPFKWLWNWLVGNSLVPDLVNAVRDWFQRMRDWVSDLIATMRDWVVARFTALRDRALTLVAALRDRVVAFFVNLRDRARSIAETIRDWVVARFTNLRDRALTLVAVLRDRAVGFFVNLRDRARGIADNLRDWVVTRVQTLRDRVVRAFERIRDRAIDAFDKAQSGIKRVWDKVKNAAKTPVNFIIGTVYTNGIKKFWDSIADKVGMPTLPTIRKLERGGRTEGGTPGVDSIPALLMADEYVLRRSSAKSIGYQNLEYMNRTGELPPVQKFNRGGIVGEAVSGFLSKGRDFFVDGFMAAVRAVTGPIKTTMNEMFGRTGFKGLPTRMVEHVIGKLEDFLTPFESELSGGSGQKVVEIARKEVGVSGRPNKYTRAPGMWTDEWCGMFVDWVFKRANAFSAISAVKGTPAVRNYTVLPSTSRANARPGDLPLYRGDDGHINILADPKTGETIGGNESNSVRRQFGYVNTASSIRRPKFAAGGQVDAEMVRRAGGLDELRNVAWQDHVETPFAGNLARRHRELFSKPSWAGTPTGLAGVAGTHDSGGVVLDDHAAINRKGEAEAVATLQDLRAWAAAAQQGGGDTYVTVNVDISKVRNLNDLLRLVESVQHTARSHGARTRVGAP